MCIFFKIYQEKDITINSIIKNVINISSIWEHIFGVKFIQAVSRKSE